MMGHRELPSAEYAPPELAHVANKRQIAGRFFVAVVVLAALVMALRLFAIWPLLDDAVANQRLLNAAMRAAAGTPISPVEASSWLDDRRAPTGFQARAMSKIARDAGQVATTEVWLMQGQSDPTSAFLAQFELCLFHWNQGQVARARESCRGTKASANFWLNRGYAADKEGDQPAALTYFQMASSIDPDLVPAWRQLGHALSAAGRFDEAITAHEHILALDATPDGDVFHSLSRAYLEVGNPARARQVLERGLLINPQQRPLYSVMAETYRAENNLEMADDWYEQLLQRWPDDAQAWAHRGEVAINAGRLRDAEGFYQEATTIQPDNVGYWMSLATTAAATDNRALATEAYRRVMELRPDDASNWLRAGRFLAETEQVDDAIEVFQHVLELQPSNAEAAMQLAELQSLTEE